MPHRTCKNAFNQPKIKARDLDPIAMKMEWIEMCERAEEEMIRLADTQLAMPITPPASASAGGLKA